MMVGQHQQGGIAGESSEWEVNAHRPTHDGLVRRVLVRLTTQARVAGPDTVPVSQWLHNSHPRSSEG